ncbi:MAG: UDP-N-acetylglucosamine 1-carboxyvinyltransferase [Candidatus Gracilibacteria bacterium]|nr:UDP-N-acetylglucosamine 1-carboxyvinyltransferase [Candidatus Gracilibacteria bacterium]
MRFLVNGGRPLRGSVDISGSKNAALPILAATLLSKEESVLTNVPDIRDIHKMLEIMEHLGSQFSFENNTIRIQTESIKTTEIPLGLVKTMRASILLVGPMLIRTGHIRIGFPGGCVLGKRPIDTHLDAFRALGTDITEEEEYIDFKLQSPQAGKVVLKEISVTATENILMLAAGIPGDTEIRLAAQEPHVADLCEYLKSCGVELSGEGTHVVKVKGTPAIHGAEHRIIADYLEVGTFAIAAAATQGDVTLQGIRMHDLDALWQKLEEMGVILDFGQSSVRVRGVKQMAPIAKLDTGIFPKFPTDLQAPFVVLLTQAHGVSKVFETLFEGRLNYLFELEKMGARFEFLNPHQAIILGPSELKGAPIASCDIRAGAGMVVAALMAEGETEISSINYIDRGYERLDEKLRHLGANIVRMQSEQDIEAQQRSLASFAAKEKSGVSSEVNR